MVSSFHRVKTAYLPSQGVLQRYFQLNLKDWPKFAFIVKARGWDVVESRIQWQNRKTLLPLI